MVVAVVDKINGLNTPRRTEGLCSMSRVLQRKMVRMWLRLRGQLVVTAM